MFYSCFRKKHKEIAKLIRQGVIIQCNATSIMDRRESLATKRMIKKLFCNYLVDVVASDGHDDSERPPLMRKCAEYISKKYGKEYAETLFSENPKKILNNESI
jgi:protein-tyrosine phosphatase